jgi:hypothetical protein
MTARDGMRINNGTLASEPGFSRSGQGSPVVSGRLVVVGMFAFGILLTSLLYTYWDLHTRPFRALQEAIAREIPGSSPRVIGGKHKSHRPGSPNTLRIIVLVGYNPLDASNEATRDELAREILQLARTHHDVTPYERIELHLEHRIPERPAEFWSSVRTPAEWESFSAQKDGRSS